MPKKIASQKENTEFEKLAVFSELVIGTSQSLRNHLNESQLSEWLEGVASEKLGNSVDESVINSVPASRNALCRLWVTKVARGHMVRKGECEKASLSERNLALGPEWLRRAASGGASVTRLLMTRSEREELCSILDWLRSDQGPSLASDWTKISWTQALEAEKLWIDKMGKAAAKKDMEASDALGTEFFCSAASPNGSAGWRWVRLASADSLDREGSMMKHCVGSYAKDVKAGRMEIYSLRDGLNKPLLTIEEKGPELRQLKAFANQSCPGELRGCVGEFLSVFTQSLASGVGPKLSRDFEAAGYAAVTGLGVVDQQKGLSKDQKEMFVFWTKDATAGGNGAIQKLGQVFPFFAKLGFVEAVKVCLELGETTSFDRSQALMGASHGGHLEVVKILLPVSDPKAGESRALAEACNNGHFEAVKLLLPVSDPKANSSWALVHACRRGHLEVAKLLLPVSDPKAGESQALRLACENGHLEVVKLLLPVSNPKENGSWALRLACGQGHLEVVKILLPVSDPKAGESKALAWACMYGHLEVVKILLPVSDPKDIEKAESFVAGNDREAILRLLAASKINFASEEPLRVNDSATGSIKGSVAANLSKRRAKVNPASGHVSVQAP